MQFEHFFTIEVLSLICFTRPDDESQRKFLCMRKTQGEGRADIRVDVPAGSDTLKLGLGISVWHFFLSVSPIMHIYFTITFPQYMLYFSRLICRSILWSLPCYMLALTLKVIQFTFSTNTLFFQTVVSVSLSQWQLSLCFQTVHLWR